MRQPRAFDIPPRSESSILLGSTRSTGAFDARDDPGGPVTMVEETISPLGLAIDAAPAFLCLGLGGRCFFIAYSCSRTWPLDGANYRAWLDFVGRFGLVHRLSQSEEFESSPMTAAARRKRLLNGGGKPVLIAVPIKAMRTLRS